VDLAFVPVGRDPPAFRIPEGNLDKTLFETIPDNQMSLSCTGHAQARAAGQELRKLLQDENLYCFVSPFLRTVQTLSGVLEAFPEEQIAGIREDSRLREQEWGNFQDANLFNNIAQERLAVGRFWYRFSTGESGADVFGRADSFLDTLYRTLDAVAVGRQAAQNVLIVTHGLTARFLMMRYFRWSVATFESVCNPNNAELWVLTKDRDGKYQLSQTEGNRVRSYMNVTVEFTDGHVEQREIPDYHSIRPPRKANRQEILKRLGLDSKDVLNINFHSAPHIKDRRISFPSSTSDRCPEIEVESKKLIRNALSLSRFERGSFEKDDSSPSSGLHLVPPTTPTT
jgi:broad specificity phosphatase PhoE